MSDDLQRHLMRYLVAGASTTVLCWGCVWLFVEAFGLHYLVSTNLATFCAYFYSYLVNKLFVFGDRKGRHVVKGSKFLTLQFTLLLFTNVFMFISVSMFNVHYMIAVIVVSVVNAMISFVVMRLAIFDVDSGRT
ncbi:MAG: GtrA family protein [bacterium]|nr:GtrA family protein [Gammaproteobacteria bacterium]HIL96527.1 GtrA family protein [Pseudomonadales bacterium]